MPPSKQNSWCLTSSVRSSVSDMVRPLHRNALLPQRLTEGVVTDLLVGHDGSVGQESRRRAVLVAGAAILQPGHRYAPLVALPVDAAGLAHFHFAPFRERIDDTGSNAVKSAGNLVRRVLELAAGVQFRHHDLDRRHTLGRVNVHGDTDTVVTDPDDPVGGSRLTSIFVHLPARASSMELSTISRTRFINPWTPVDPMYMPGRLRTASRPSRTWMFLALYSCMPALPFPCS